MKPDLFSRAYENLDQELKEACLKYQEVVRKRGLKINYIKLAFTPGEAPYIDIQVDEAPRIKEVRPQKATQMLQADEESTAEVPAPKPKKKRPSRPKDCAPGMHPKGVCNGLGRVECLLCDEDMGPCTSLTCERCLPAAPRAVQVIPPKRPSPP